MQLRRLAEPLTGDLEMKAGVWFYGLATVLTGILNIAWGEFDASHQPIKSLGIGLPSEHILAYIVGLWLVAAGLAILWRRSVKTGAAACAVIYLIFAAFWLFRFHAGVHALGWRIDIVFGVAFGISQQLLLIAPAPIVYASAASADSLSQKRAATAARWLLGLPPIVFGLGHLIGLRVFASIVPHWIPFGSFWAALTGLAFLLAGIAICSKRKDVLAARLLALMLLLFEGLVEIPPIFVRTHNQAAWGAAVYNLTAIGGCLIFADFLEERAARRRSELAGTAAPSRTVVA